MAQDNLFRSLHRDPIDRQHLIDDAKYSIESRLDGVAAFNGNIAVQDLLQDLGIRDETLTFADELFEPSLCVRLMGVRRPDKIHRDVRIHQNHGWGPLL
jgi:hypothetical protein